METGSGEAAHADSRKVARTLRRNGGHETVRAMGRIKCGSKSCGVGDGIAQGAQFDFGIAAESREVEDAHLEVLCNR